MNRPTPWLENLETYRAFYEERIARIAPNLRHFNPFRMQMFKPAPGMSIIDLGCGPGGTVRHYARRGHPVTGVDIAQSALDDLTERMVGQSWAERITLIRSDLESFQPPHEFDCVLCNEVLEHVIDPAPLFATMARCCKPGGVVYITTPSVVTGPDVPGSPHVRGVPPDEMTEYMDGAGLKIYGLWLVPNVVDKPFDSTFCLGYKPMDGE